MLIFGASTVASYVHACGFKIRYGGDEMISCRERIHLHHEEPVQSKARGGGKTKDLSKKAILLSGPPGIGKTSSAMIVARCV